MQSFSYLVVYLLAVYHFSARIKPFKKSKSSAFVLNSVHSLETNVVLGIDNLQQRTELCLISTSTNLACS